MVLGDDLALELGAVTAVASWHEHCFSESPAPVNSSRLTLHSRWVIGGGVRRGSTSHVATQGTCDLIHQGCHRQVFKCHAAGTGTPELARERDALPVIGAAAQSR